MAIEFDNDGALTVVLANAITLPITIVCWAMSPVTTGGEGIRWAVGLGESGGDRIGLGRTPGSNLRVHARVSGVTNLDGGSTTNGQQHHFMGVWRSATDREGWVDGASIGTSSASRDPSPLDIIHVGWIEDANTNTRWSGTLMEVAIWNADMSAYAAQLADAAHPRSPAFYGRENLVFYRSFVSDINGGPMHLGPQLSTVGTAPTIVPHLVGGKGVVFPE